MTLSSQQTPQCFSKDVKIAHATYYGIGGVAKWFARPKSFKDIQLCLQFAKQNSLPVAVLGTGSNSVYSDDVFEGVLISLGELNAWYWETSEILYAEAGVTNTEVAEICLDAGRANASWMYRMPGQLGATVRMNARCYGGEISEIVKNIVTLNTIGELKTYESSDVFRGYKSTSLMATPEVVVAVRLHFPKAAARTDLLAHMQQCESDRHRKHHFDYPSCGSTFKNNYAIGKPSGQVFDELGLKGFRSGHSEVSQFHANFVWNTSGASAKDMLAVAGEMRTRAKQLKNYEVELEVQPIGTFSQLQFDVCGMQNLGPHIKSNEKYWIGLLDHPALPTTEVTYPHILISAPYQEYCRTPLMGLENIMAQMTQMVSLKQAIANPDQPFLQWQTYGSHLPETFHKRPSEAPESFVDELWNYSVAEVFFGHPQKTNYLEFEATPEKHWIALRFANRRQRDTNFMQPNATLWSGAKTFSESNRFGFIFSYNCLEEVIDENGRVNVQCMLSLGDEKYFLAPHWKTETCATEICDFAATPPKVNYDFHQPNRFWHLKLH